MKCDKCPFSEHYTGSYGSEWVCRLFGDYVPDLFYEDGGCNLKYQEAKKLLRLEDDVEEGKKTKQDYLRYYEELERRKNR